MREDLYRFYNNCGNDVRLQEKIIYIPTGRYIISDIKKR